MKSDNLKPQEQTIASFLVGLDMRIAKIVQLQQYWTLNYVIKLSLKVEQLRKVHGSSQGDAQEWQYLN